MSTPDRSDELFDSAAIGAIEAVWYALEDRVRYVIQERLGGRTLADVGKELKLTRERVRQLQYRGTQRFLNSVYKRWPGIGQWSQAVHKSLVLDINPIITRFSDSDLATTFVVLFLDHFGWVPYSKGSQWWARDRAAIKEAIDKLVFDEPVLVKEWSGYCDESVLPREFVFHLIKNRKFPVEEFRGYMIRSGQRRFDKVHVYLLEHGPSNIEDISRSLGEGNIRSFEEALRRQDRFVKNLVERKWALEGTIEVKFRNATDALLHLLETRGAMSREGVVAEMSRIYPVSYGRVVQCLNDYRIGTLPDGRYELIARGAKRDLEPEPARPTHMTCAGQIIGVKKRIDRNILRGSGINDHKWLAWKIGLHSTPMKKVFSGKNGLKEIFVKRSGENSQMSSIREIVEEQSLVEGCYVVIILDLARSEWELRHICTECEVISKPSAG